MTNELVRVGMLSALALSAQLHEGRLALERGDYAAAVTTLTAVIEAKAAAVDLATAARWLRAHARIQAGAPGVALDDLKWLATHPVQAELRRSARDLLRAQGRPESELLPIRSPREEWQALQKLLDDNDDKDPVGAEQQLADYLAPDFLASVRRLFGGLSAEMLREMLEQEPAELVGERIDPENGEAELRFRQSDMHYRVLWVQVGDRWKISAVNPERVEPGQEALVVVVEPGAAEPAGGTTNVSAALATEVESWVRQLGDEDARVRARARDELIAQLSQIRSFLRAYTNDPDPEIRWTVRELLSRP